MDSRDRQDRRQRRAAGTGNRMARGPEREAPDPDACPVCGEPDAGDRHLKGCADDALKAAYKALYRAGDTTGRKPTGILGTAYEKALGAYRDVGMLLKDDSEADT